MACRLCQLHAKVSADRFFCIDCAMLAAANDY